MKFIGKKEALFIAKKLHADFVYNMAFYEKNPFTYPEIETVLEGITVGGHTLFNQDQVLRISTGWQEIIQQVSKNCFQINKDNFIYINELIARNEALSVGSFRDSGVFISGADYIPPTSSDDLEALFNQMLKNYQQETDRVKKGFGLFLDAARAQFFFDGNKRTAQLMMNGHLMQAGYPPVSLRPDLLQEYDEKMINFYNSGDKTEMFEFLSEQQSCMVNKFYHIANNN